MSQYKAPIRDMQFQMNELLDFPGHYQSFPQGQEATPDIVDAILESAAQFSEEVLAPLDAVGDEEGCQWTDGEVTTPTGFKDAYEQYMANGWIGLSHPVELGGQGLPGSLKAICMEMLAGANHAWTMYPGLSLGGTATISAHASEALKKLYLPNLVSGKWSATMCLTESHCGSDLGMLRTKAEPAADGSYSIQGSKIFISSGDHDLTENIIHITLARLPDAPAGIKGISLFLVPKFNVNDDGSVGDRNQVSCGSIEHKMGIHGNATCVINFDGARGFLISPPHRGMSCMFTFINESRLGVAQQALAHIEKSYQNALIYARERVQFRSATNTDPDAKADPIIVHPDVRRMLLTQKAYVEGGRSLNYYCAKLTDITHYHDDEAEQKRADDLLSILTPIAKGFMSEASLEATSYGIQIFGGHGYIKEWGQEQQFRDTRITTLYEGTSGIQGLDLLGRKILGSGGEALKPFFTQVGVFCAENAGNSYAHQVQEKMECWRKITQKIGLAAMSNPDEVNAAAYDYLMFCGFVVLAYFWAKSAVVAQQAIDNGASDANLDFYQAKLITATFYFERLLPRTLSLEKTLASGSKNLTDLKVECF